MHAKRIAFAGDFGARCRLLAARIAEMGENPYQSPAEFDDPLPCSDVSARLTLRDWLLIGAVTLGMSTFVLLMGA